jgi:methyltransferase
MTLAVWVMALVTLQRLGELVIARRNTAALLADGAHEVAPEHYPLIVAVHTAWLAALWWLAARPALEPSAFWLIVFLLLQLGRVWVLATLGRRWTTRIIVLPGAPLVKTGPFRFLSHPNYAIVTAEIAVLPIAFGLFGVAVVFTVLNAAVLAIRIRAEAEALRIAVGNPRHVDQEPAAHE